ncbi:hypothetical protein D3872_23725 [Massilia cavernae]|uniref:Uncharacterized protein n=1 Tax=Massilia cavernae TaxID=2320864 RepID=A0A418X7J9_9BURK|nr:hypothetical protein D3872_23725 [Massilia cavernae]
MAEPTASVHKACNGWGETMAAYRFFDNEALYLVVAWRIAHLMRMGRTCPDPDANLFFDPNEIQAAYLLNKAPAPPVPRLNEVVRMIARIGGFLARKVTANRAPRLSGRDAWMSVPLLLPSKPFMKWACFQVVYNEMGQGGYRCMGLTLSLLQHINV